MKHQSAKSSTTDTGYRRRVVIPYLFEWETKSGRLHITLSPTPNSSKELGFHFVRRLSKRRSEACGGSGMSQFSLFDELWSINQPTSSTAAHNMVTAISDKAVLFVLIGGTVRRAAYGSRKTTAAVSAGTTWRCTLLLSSFRYEILYWRFLMRFYRYVIPWRAT